MESAFTYRGGISSLNAALDTFGQRLTQAYTDVLGQRAAHFFAAIRDTLPPYAYLENLGMKSLLEDANQKLEDIKKRGNSPLENALLSTYLSLSANNEVFAIELSRRLFERLGLTLPTNELEGFPLPQSYQVALAKAPDNLLIERFVELRMASLASPLEKTLYDSLFGLKVKKIKPREEHIALVKGGSPHKNWGEDEDNAFAVGNDYNTMQASIGKDGRITYPRNITAYPILIFSEGAMAREQEKLKLEPPLGALYSFTHEMNHFLLYALQRFPMQLAWQIVAYHLFSDMQKIPAKS